MIVGLKRAWEALRRQPPPDDRWRGWNAMHRIQAAYEAALSRDDLWTLADFKDADASLLPEVRRRIRSRARYEYANNSVVARIVDVWVGDVCGEAGPSLQVHSGRPEIDRFIEQAWDRWWRVSNQAAKLRTGIKAEAIDGEAVGVLISNDRLRRHRQPVGVDVAGIECDRLASPGFENANRSDYVDGVHIDPFTREPQAYDLLKAHPGTEYLDAVALAFEHETFPRAEVLHAFRRLRPEQHRGVCRYSPVLPVSGLHRKYFESEVSRNQLRAAFAFVMKTMAPPETGEDGGSVPESQWWTEINLPNRSGAGLMLPEGYDVTQLRPDGTAAELEAFHRIIGGLVAGCFTMPVGRALGLYGSAGYAGVRAEMMPYHRAIATDRWQVWEPLWLTPLYEAFLFELTRSDEWQQLLEELRVESPEASVKGLTRHSSLDSLDLHHIEWNWPEKELVVDPSREETARKHRLAMGLTTRERELDSADVDEHDRRAAHLLGIDDVQVYRRLVAQSIHGAPVQDPAAAMPADDAPAAAGGEDLPANITTDNPLNGAQIASAIEVVQSVRNGTLTPIVARELLTALGFPPERVERMVASAGEAKAVPADAPALPAEAADNADGDRFAANCGTGAGGFKPGNRCGKLSAGTKRTLLQRERFRSRVEGLKTGTLRDKDSGAVIRRDMRLDVVEQAAVVDYTDRRSALTINSYLRGQTRPRGADRIDREARIEALDSALEKLPATPGTSWRGMPSDYVGHLRKGDSLGDPAFFSTTTNRAHSELKRGRGRAIIQVKGRSGRSIRHTSLTPSEGEVLFRRGSPFRLAKRSRARDGTLLLTIEEAPDGS